MLVLGGGGYTIRNVARCWTYETSLLVDVEISNELPFNDYFEYFAPDFQLHPEVTGRFENLNSKQYLENVKIRVLEQLRALQGAPGVQMIEVPPDFLTMDSEDDDKDPDVRETRNYPLQSDASELYNDDFDHDHEEFEDL